MRLESFRARAGRQSGLLAGLLLVLPGCGGGPDGGSPAGNARAVSSGIRDSADRAEVLEKEAAELVAKIQGMEKTNNESLHILHHNLGCVYRQSGRFAEAEREYLEAMRMDPAAADTCLGLGLLYESNLKEPAKARSYFERYLTLAPKGPHAGDVRQRLAKLPVQPASGG